MIVIVAMLFAVILSLLAIAGLSHSVLLTKESNYLINKNLSLVTAENNLQKNVQQLLSDNLPKGAELIGEDCGIKFYRLAVQSEHGSIKSVVVSTVAKVGDISHCVPKPKIKSGVKSQRIL